MPKVRLDIYQGWSEDQLKERCRKLVRAVGEWQRISMALAMGGIEALSVEDRSDVENLLAAHNDDFWL